MPASLNFLDSILDTQLGSQQCGQLLVNQATAARGFPFVRNEKCFSVDTENLSERVLLGAAYFRGLSKTSIPPERTSCGAESY